MRPVVGCRCEWCGGTFEALQYRVDRGGARFCSKSCAGRVRRGPLSSTWKGGVSKDHTRYSRRFRAKFPERYKAHNVLWNAIERGRVTRQSYCQECGAGGRIAAHHDDYTKALDVRWLCRACHIVADRKRQQSAAA